MYSLPEVHAILYTDVFLWTGSSQFSNNFIDHSVQVILDPKVVARKYLRGWFAVDFISSFPFDYFTLIATGGEISPSLLKASRALRVIRLAKLLSLVRLLRISKLLRFIQRWEDVSPQCYGNCIKTCSRESFAIVYYHSMVSVLCV